MMRSRNTIIGFGARTRTNLELAERSFSTRGDFHVVTQLVNSLLGIVVVPLSVHDRTHDSFSNSLSDLYVRGWPPWDIQHDAPKPSMPTTQTLGDLVWHLRNAAAHGRFLFLGEPDSRYLSDVQIQVEDAPGEKEPVNWRAQISAEGLYEFCLLLSVHIDQEFT